MIGARPGPRVVPRNPPLTPPRRGTERRLALQLGARMSPSAAGGVRRQVWSDFESLGLAERCGGLRVRLRLRLRRVGELRDAGAPATDYCAGLKRK
jgi:hypothetical protein